MRKQEPAPAVRIVVETDDVEIHQSAEILFRELKVRGLAAALGNGPASVLVNLSDETLQQGNVELVCAQLDRRRRVALEDAADITVEWINDAKLKSV
jgi:hypothetical protein